MYAEYIYITYIVIYIDLHVKIWNTNQYILPMYYQNEQSHFVIHSSSVYLNVFLVYIIVFFF